MKSSRTELEIPIGALGATTRPASAGESCGRAMSFQLMWISSLLVFCLVGCSMFTPMHEPDWSDPLFAARNEDEIVQFMAVASGGRGILQAECLVPNAVNWHELLGRVQSAAQVSGLFSTSKRSNDHRASFILQGDADNSMIAFLDWRPHESNCTVYLAAAERDQVRAKRFLEELTAEPRTDAP